PAEPLELLANASEFVEEAPACGDRGRSIGSQPRVDLVSEPLDRARRVQLFLKQASDLGLGDIAPHEDAVGADGRASTPPSGTPVLLGRAGRGADGHGSSAGPAGQEAGQKVLAILCPGLAEAPGGIV